MNLYYIVKSVLYISLSSLFVYYCLPFVLFMALFVLAYMSLRVFFGIIKGLVKKTYYIVSEFDRFVKYENLFT